MKQRVIILQSSLVFI